MNSVMEIGENICLLDKGELAWSGTKDQVLRDENETLHDFIFASPFLQKLVENIKK
jgi:phospholipid/cholesterol/gamma-HCH transport system ATP-binding protein